MAYSDVVQEYYKLVYDILYVLQPFEIQSLNPENHNFPLNFSQGTRKMAGIRIKWSPV